MELTHGLQQFLILFVPFMMAVVFHEYAHGFIARRWGDTTAEDMGRLTLNPIPHVDLMGTVILPAMFMISGVNILFGWAKPVPINPNRFKKFRQGLFWVSLAGPAMNVILAVFSALILCLLNRFVPHDFYLFEPLMGMAEGSVYINFALCIFNLLPLPPLDGSKIVESFLSYQAMQKYESIAQYSFWIFMVLIFTRALSFLAYPIEYFGKLTIGLMMVLFGGVNL